MIFESSNGLSTNESFSRINKIPIETRQKVHDLFDLPGDSIESPSKSKGFIRLDRFWSETVPRDTKIPTDKEIFLGFDFDANSKKIICTETTLGGLDYCEPKSNHLIMLHTEPANSPEDLSLKLGPIHLYKPSKAAVFADNFPTPYTADMQAMLRDPSVYAEIIIRLGLNDDPATILVAIQTNQFKDVYDKLWKHELRNLVLDEKHPLSQTLAEDKLITQDGGIAIYRGFIHLPPEHDDILRLRKYS